LISDHLIRLLLKRKKGPQRLFLFQKSEQPLLWKDGLWQEAGGSLPEKGCWSFSGSRVASSIKHQGNNSAESPHLLTPPEFSLTFPRCSVNLHTFLGIKRPCSTKANGMGHVLVQQAGLG